MAIQTEPTRIQIPFADSGTKNVIPDTNSTPSASQAASWTDGFPAQCSLPLSAGGIPPARADFNGIFNTMTQSERFLQEGGVWAWDATVDYGTNRLVLGSDGLLYWSIAQSGPNVGGAQDPTADASHTYWISPKVPTMDTGDNSKTSVNSEWVRAWYSTLILPSDFYVDVVNGDDSNDGRSALTAKKTIGAMEAFLGGAGVFPPQNVNIHIASGTYPEMVRGVFGISVTYSFASGSKIAGTQVVGSGRTVVIDGDVTITNGQIWSQDNAYITLGVANKTLNLTFDNVSAVGLIRGQGGRIVIDYYATAVNLIFNSCTVSGGTVSSESNGFVNFSRSSGTTLTWSGTVTGRKYRGIVLSAIVGVGGANVIPGTTAGTVDSTSFYS